tara:strand:- start:375 stop:824 length:450 start_codon:yes stop_codon:yes gene_type:complete
MSTRDKNILKLARQRKGNARLSADDLKFAEREFNKMSPGEKKARFGEDKKKNKFGPRPTGGLNNELDSFQNMVQNKLKVGLGNLFQGVEMGPLGPFKKVTPKKFKDVKKKVLKAKGASPGRIKAEFGTEMSRGGEVDVVDLTTEMEVNE